MNNLLYDIADYAFASLRSNGADGAELGMSRGRMDELNIDAGKFSLLRTTFNSSLRIRALVGGRKGTALTNSLDREAVAQAAAQAVESARSSEPDGAEYIADDIGTHEFTLGAGACDLDGLFERVREFQAGCGERYPTIDLGQMIARYSSDGGLYANTNGTRVFTDAAAYGYSIRVSARSGDKVSSMNGLGFTVDSLSEPLLARGETVRLLSETERQIDTAPVEGKFVGTLLVAPDCLAEFLFSVIGSCAGDTALISGSSPWKSMPGAAVADSRLSVSLDPLDARVVCGARVTADGHLVKRQDIIRGGTLAGWSLSQYGAKKTGLARSGNVSGNIIVGAGDKSFDELVAGIEHGLLINRFSGGSPSQNGDFSGVAKNSFLIRGGAIAGAVSETMVSGNLLDMLKNVRGISRDIVCDGSSALPWAAFGGVTISGK